MITAHIVGVIKAVAFVPTVTFNPADKDSDVILSNLNRTLGCTGLGGYANARATLSRSTGKYYAECVFDSPGFDATGFGLANAAHAITGYIGGPGGNSCSLFDGLRVYPQATDMTLLGTITAGQTICFAFDLDTRKFWLRKNGGSWYGFGNALGDPSSGTNGLVITPATGAVFPAGTVSTNTQFITARLAGAEMGFAVPSGYLPWAGS